MHSGKEGGGVENAHSPRSRFLEKCYQPTFSVTKRREKRVPDYFREVSRGDQNSLANRGEKKNMRGKQFFLRTTPGKERGRLPRSTMGEREGRFRVKIISHRGIGFGKKKKEIWA